MSAATLDAPQPEDNEQVTGMAALILRTTKANAATAQSLAKALVGGGARVNVKEQTDFTDVEQAFERVLEEKIQPLNPTQIAHDAHLERIARLKAAAAHSASQLVPSPSDHAQMNRMLDEMAGVA